MTKKTARKIITFDWAIKTILRDKANFDVLEGFLTALLGRPITILDMLENEGNRRDEADKYNRVDLLAKTGDGERIIVEVQYCYGLRYFGGSVPHTGRGNRGTSRQPDSAHGQRILALRMCQGASFVLRLALFRG